MKKLRNLVSMLAMLSLAAVLTGCGGDDDDDDDNNNNPPAQPQFAPGTQEAFRANTYTVTLDGGQTATLTFPNANSYSLTSGGQTETGTITGLTRNGEDYVATLTPANNDGRARAGEMRVHFTQKNNNTFAGTLTIQEAGGAKTYPFTAAVQQNPNPNPNPDPNPNPNPNPDPDPNPNPNPNPDPNPNPNPNPTTPPTSLVGKTLQLNYPTIGGGERFDFTSENSAIYEQGSDTFSYTYDAQNTRLTGTRRNAAGTDVASYDIDLTFNQGSGTAGTATVIYRDLPNGTPQTDPANFTITP